MAFALGPKATVAGYRLAAYETIGSTNREALERARRGETGRLWVAAAMQTEGRGRRGRPWQTPLGNLAASVLHTLPDGQTNPATLGFAAGLALESAIRMVAPALASSLGGGDSTVIPSRGGLENAVSPVEQGLRLKWPNDVLIDGAKVAGILLEAATVPGRPSSVAVGFGVNVRRRPDGLSYPATSLAACGAGVTAAALFEALAEAWVDEEARWNVGQGFEEIRKRWLQNAAGVGAPIAVMTGEAVVSGTFETVDDSGRLVVRAPNGQAHLVSAGEVHFGSAAGTAAG